MSTLYSRTRDAIRELRSRDMRYIYWEGHVDIRVYKESLNINAYKLAPYIRLVKR